MNAPEADLKYSIFNLQYSIFNRQYSITGEFYERQIHLLPDRPFAAMDPGHPPADLPADVLFIGSVCYGRAILPEDAHAKQRRPQD